MKGNQSSVRGDVSVSSHQSILFRIVTSELVWWLQVINLIVLDVVVKRDNHGLYLLFLYYQTQMFSQRWSLLNFFMPETHKWTWNWLWTPKSLSLGLPFTWSLCKPGKEFFKIVRGPFEPSSKTPFRIQTPLWQPLFEVAPSGGMLSYFGRHK